MELLVIWPTRRNLFVVGFYAVDKNCLHKFHRRALRATSANKHCEFLVSQRSMPILTWCCTCHNNIFQCLIQTIVLVFVLFFGQNQIPAQIILDSNQFGFGDTAPLKCKLLTTVARYANRVARDEEETASSLCWAPLTKQLRFRVIATEMA